MNKEEMIQLRNTLAMIETKGESTKLMANCLQFLEAKVQMIDAPTPGSEAVPA